MKGFGANSFKGGETRSFTAKEQTRGVLQQISEGTQWVKGESDAKGFDGE